MPLLQDAIEAQRSQYPYSMPPTAEQEALQSPNIISDVVNRLIGPFAGRMAGPTYGPRLTNYAAQMLPILAMGGSDPEEDVAALRGVTSELKALRTAPLSMREAPVPALRFPSGEIHLGQPGETAHYQIYQRLLDENPGQHMQFLKPESGWIWRGKFRDRNEMTGMIRRIADAAYPGMAGTEGTTGPLTPAPTEPFGRYKVESQLSPFERTYWKSMGKNVPRKPVPETMPLPELEVQPERYHGTGQEITKMLPTEEASKKGLLVGPGLYTTDKIGIARGYGTGGVTYRVYEATPNMKFLDEKQPIPLSALKRARDFLPGKTKWGGVGEAGAWDPHRYEGRPSYDVFKLLAYDAQSPQNDRAVAAITKALQEEGYHGLTHTGGIVGGGEKHAVKVYWNKDDVRLVPTHQYQTSYVRDKPIPGYPGQFGFSQHFKRVARPLMGK